ncbi:hypothetical protein VP1G_01322 [Cytospora mali]|uniref:Uncharacterized protein n=1 Tax=Cytospora mali TaxID=578113 RepID=A0A194UQW5_CYTMA|nr:hypothetical protein VP1G_01322 [Valsa mali var. pyri (nom. inval.)]
MASRLFLLAVAGSAAVAQMESMSGMEPSTTMEGGDAMTAHSSSAAAGSSAASWTEASMTSIMTSMPSAIMPSDVSASLGGSTTPTTLVVDTMTPPAPSSGKTWAMATPEDVSGVSTSGIALSTGSSSNKAGSTGAATVNGMSSVYNKISMGLLALCIVASAAVQM